MLEVLLTPKCVLNPRAYQWTPIWNGGSAVTPHSWIAHKRLRGAYTGIVAFEVELGNASVVIGQVARASFSCQVQVSAPSGWTIAADLDRPWPTVWPPMHCEIRRYALYPTNRPDLAAAALDYAQGIYRMANAQSFGPCNMQLPTLTAAETANISNLYQQRLSLVRGALLTGGTVYLEQEDGPQLPGWNGWRWHGPYDSGDGSPGGSGVFFDTGWQQCANAVKFFWLEASLVHARSWHAYDRATGMPITAESYGDPGPEYILGNANGGDNPATQIGWLPEFWPVMNHNPYTQDIPFPYNNSHRERGDRFCIALSEMIDSAIVARSLGSAAAHARLQWSEIGKLPYPNPPVCGSTYLPESLRNEVRRIAGNPGSWNCWPANRGSFLQAGRIRAWTAFVIAQDAKINGTSTQNAQAWLQNYVLWMTSIATPQGVTQRSSGEQPSGCTNVWYYGPPCNDPVTGDPIQPPGWDLAHAFEVPIAYYGKTAAAIQGGIAISPEIETVTQNMYRFGQIGGYYGGEQGPMEYMFVGVYGSANSVPTGGIRGTGYTPSGGNPHGPGGDATHCDAMCALADAVNPNGGYLSDSLNVGHATADIASKMAFFHSQALDTNLTDVCLYGRAFLMARYQIAGYL